MPAGVAAATASQISFSYFFFFYNGPHGGFICLEAAVTRAAGTHRTAQRFLVTS